MNQTSLGELRDPLKKFQQNGTKKVHKKGRKGSFILPASQWQEWNSSAGKSSFCQKARVWWVIGFPSLLGHCMKD